MRKKWVRLLAYVTGSVNQELLQQNKYLATENRILRAKLPSRWLSNSERVTLAEVGKRLGRKALREVACVVRRSQTMSFESFDIGRQGGNSLHIWPHMPRRTTLESSSIERVYLGLPATRDPDTCW
jgi:hypothetical protein